MIHILRALQAEMPEPQAWGWFHLLCLSLMLVGVVLLCRNKSAFSEKRLKWIIGTYGFAVFTTELLKQISWSCTINEVSNTVIWNYQWYAFPFQLCSTPIYVCLVCFFLRKSKWRDALLSYLAYVTIWGSLSTVFFPNSCLVSDILANIHTMALHYGSLAISIYLLVSGEVRPTVSSLKSSLFIFYVLAFIANTMNFIAVHSGIIGDETFNMFYISPYFISELPVFSTIQYHSPYPIYLLIYLFTLSFGSTLIYVVSKTVAKKNVAIVDKKMITTG